VANPAVRLDFDQPPDVHLNLLAEIAFDAPFLLDDLADTVHFILGQIADLLRVIHARLFRNPSRALLPNAVDRRQADPQPLLRRKVHTCDTCHSLFSLILSTCSELIARALGRNVLCPGPQKSYPWRCLCFGLLQMTRTTPRR
jgi:hypothetical protein